jgi:hypothetical protein
MGTDYDGRGLERQRRIVELVGAGAKVCLLRNGRPFEDLDSAECVGVGAVTQACAVMQDKIPRKLDTCALMHEWLSVDGCPECAQP